MATIKCPGSERHDSGLRQPLLQPQAGELGGRKVEVIHKGKWDKSTKKVGTCWDKFCVGFKFLFVGLAKAIKFCVCLEFVTIPWNAFLDSLYSDRGTLCDGYKKAVSKRFDNLRYKGTEDTEFRKKIKGFSDELPELSKDPKKLRARIVELSKDSEYDLNGVDPASKFLQECGHALESADMTHTLWMYGRRKIGEHAYKGDEDDKIDYVKYASGIEKGLLSFDRRRDGPARTLLWAMDNLDRLPHVVEAELDPLGYDSYENQMVFQAGTLKDGEHEIIHKYTPGLTGPQSIVERVLIPKYRNESRRWLHIDNQSIHAPDERQRIDEVHRIAERNRDVFFHAVLSTDTLDVVNKDLIQRFECGEITFEAFAEEYETALRGKDDQFVRNYDECRGIHIPKELLSDEELQAAFAAAREMSIAAQEQARSPKEKVQLLRRNILSTLSWAMMKKEQFLYGAPGKTPSIFTMNCKENIDRGPQENDDMLFNEHMSKGIREMRLSDGFVRAGINLGRADHAMRRPPQMKRMKPMTTRWRCFKDDAAYQAGSKSLSELRKKLTAEQVVNRVANEYDNQFELDHKEPH